jgi:hypothetical protein
MIKALDCVTGIPLYTNKNDQLFEWYVIYQDRAVILEIGKYSTVNFKDIPCSNLIHLGLFGMGFHLNYSFLSKSMSIYGEVLNKAFRCEESTVLYKDSVLSEPLRPLKIIPFQFKGFNFDIISDTEQKFRITSHYLGITEEYEDLNIKKYFSINTDKYPGSFGIITKLIPKKSLSHIKYRLAITDRTLKDIEGKQSEHEETSIKQIETNRDYTFKTILGYN